MIDPNGIAHIQLTVRDVARSRPFYHRLLHETFGMPIQYDIPGVVFYCIGGRTGIVIRPAAPGQADTAFDQWRTGLHHFCFRLRSEADIDTLHAVLVEMDATIVRAPETGPWAEGYYSVLFEDPDGIRIEAVFIPGVGNLPAARQGPLTPPVS
ncbi:MAG: VOC family protein [Caulobacterales bacterium]|nr:VOC family protein [Caulobacterales bacterium]